MIPRPPSCANAIANLDSVTVSIAAETIGIFKLIFKYDIDNGTNKANILLIKDDIVKYLSKFNIHSQFKEIDINLRVNYSIDNLEYQKLIKKIGTYTNIFEDFIINKKK